VSTSLLVSNRAVSCYPALMVNLIWFADEDRDRKMQPFCKLGVLVHCALSCSNMWKSNYLHRCVNVIVLYVFMWLQL